MWTTCLLAASSGYHAEFQEGYQKHTNQLNCRTSSSDISGYHADFHEGHGAVGEWQGRGMAWQGTDMGATCARHGMCELAVIVCTVTSSITHAVAPVRWDGKEFLWRGLRKESKTFVKYWYPTYLLTHSLTYSLTSWGRVLLEKLIGLQLVKKLPAFYGTRRFTTAFTRAHHPSPS
jgi:hypothetical protein